MHSTTAQRLPMHNELNRNDHTGLQTLNTAKLNDEFSVLFSPHLEG